MTLNFSALFIRKSVATKTSVFPLGWINQYVQVLRCESVDYFGTAIPRPNGSPDQQIINCRRAANCGSYSLSSKRLGCS